MRFSRYCAPWYNHVSKETVSWTRGINSYKFGTVLRGNNSYSDGREKL